MPNRRRGKKAPRRRRRPGPTPAGLPSNTAHVERAIFGPGRALVNTKGVAGGFSDTMRVTLRYAERIALTFGSGLPQTYEFRGNSLFDPNSTGTGGQPANFDDFTAHYNRYRVMASTCMVLPANPGNNGTEHFCVLYPYNTTAASTTVEDSVAQPYAVCLSSGTYAPPVIKSTMSTAKILGRTDSEVIGSDNCQAVYSTNPADVWYWKLVAQPSDASTAVTVNFLFVIDYDAIFFDRIAGNLDLKIQRLLQLRDEKKKRQGRAEDTKEDVSVAAKLSIKSEQWSDDDEALYQEIAKRKVTTLLGGKSRTAGSG